MVNVNDLPVLKVEAGSVIAWDYKIATELYNNGFFGKPLGMRKIKPGQKLDRANVLSLFDALYLLKNKRIKVELEDKILSEKEFIQYSIDNYEGFLINYKIYEHFRELNYVVRPGLKFGGDFVIYEKGPGIDHSKWVVQVGEDNINVKAISVVRAGRLAHSVKKEFLIATIRDNQIKFYSFGRIKL